MDRENDIRARAYEIWEQEGRRDGSHEDHWKQAQDELGGPLSSEDDGDVPLSADDEQDVPLTSEDAGGMLGGQTREPAPETLGGSVKGRARKAS